MKVLLTGGTGFIGAHVAAELVGAGHEVVVLTRRPDDAEVRGRLPESDRLELRRGDLLDPTDLPPALEGCDAVIHAAGWISTRTRDRDRIWQLNHTATANLFQAALDARPSPRFIYLASIFALGTGTPWRPATEDVSYNLGHLDVDYVRAKRAAELLSDRFLGRGLELVHVYPCFCLGPGDADLSSSRVVVDYLRRRLPAYVPGGLNLVDVRDVARGHLLALERGRVGRRYLLGDHNVTYRELFALLERLTGIPAPRIAIPARLAVAAGSLAERMGFGEVADRASAVLMGEHWYYDSSRAEEELGYRGRPLDETLHDAIDWFLERTMVPVPPHGSWGRG